MNKNMLSDEIIKIENRLAKIAFEEEKSLWNQLIGENYQDRRILINKYAKLLLNNKVDLLLNNGCADDNILKKKISLLKFHQLDTKIKSNATLTDLWEKCHKTIIDFRPEIDNKQHSRSEITEILMTSPDSILREKAYKSYSPLSKIMENDLALLIKIRNEEAKKNGFDDYLDYAFNLLSINKKEVLQLFELILAKTHTLWKSVINIAKEKLNSEVINPWDLSYFLNTQLIKNTDDIFPKNRIIESFNGILEKFKLNLGILPIQIREQDIPYGGLCFVFDPGKDIRILANPNNGHKWYSTLFHEFGHALQFCTPSNLSYTLVTGDPSFFLEAMAKIFEHFTSEDEWLSSMGIADTLLIDFNSNILINRIAKIRSIIAQSLFEVQLYKEEGGDIDLRFKKHMEDINGILYPLMPNWAGNTLYVTHPIYLQNYVLAEMIAQQSIEHFKKQSGSLFKREFWDYLNEYYYTPGALIHWHEKLINATGSPLSVESFLKRFNIYENEHNNYIALNEFLKSHEARI